MKKILALLMVFAMVLALCACGGTGETSSKADDVDVSSSTQGVDDGAIDLDDLDTSSEEEETSSADEKTLELKEDIQYVVVAMIRSNIEINSTDDFANYTCAYMDGCDSAVWAEYYDFKEIGMYMMTNDLHSGLSGNNFELGIVSDSGAAGYSDWEIVWTLKAE